MPVTKRTKTAKVKRNFTARDYSLRLRPAKVFFLVAYGLALLASGLLFGFGCPINARLALSPKHQVLGSASEHLSEPDNINILPREAAGYALTTGVITEVVGNLQPVEQYSGYLAYRVDGKTHYKCLGFIDLTVPKRAWVTIDSGLVVGQEQSLIATIVETFSNK